MKVLIAEDNADDRRMLRMNLEHHGCTVLEAGNGKEALRIAREKNPALIISDALMPVMDGFQLLRAVKTDQELKHIPFIFYSAVYTGYKEAELAISLGAEAFIIKPKEPDELWSEIRDLMDSCRLKKEDRLTARLIEEDEEFLNKYSNVVAAKLEEKIRELEKAKATIEAKEQEWQTTFDAIGDCVTIHDRDFNIVLANKACEKMFGLSLPEIRSRRCYELFHGSDRPHESCPRSVVDKTKEPAEAEFFEPVLNRWLAVSCFPVFDSSGEVDSVVHFARDISVRKRAEEQLQIFRSLVDHSNDALFVIDPPSGILLDVNSQACQRLGYHRTELIGKRVADIEAVIPTDDAWHAHVEELKKSGSMLLEGEHLRKDGSAFPVEISVRYISFPKADYMVAVVRDISERKQTEKERRKLEEQLLHAQKMEAVGQLTGGIAHDFNNILSAIVGYGGLLQMKMKQDDPLRTDVDNILAASERAAALTQSLLAFSRKQVINPQPLGLNGIVTRIQSLLERVMGEDIELKTVLPDEENIVMADAGQIEQVLMNLATNARDAMPEGGVLTIRAEKIVLDDDYIRAHGYGNPGPYVLLSVSDTGAGMDRETQERIFEPFFTTKEIGRGTGLGLAVIYGIVKQHNGYINVYSEPGKGTTFRIYLPLITGEAREVKTSRSSDTGMRGNETILVAEDELSLRRLARSVLEQFGYRVIEAADGEDAIEKFREHQDRIDLLLFDLIMPRKSGKEAADEIRKITPDMPVLFTSGYTPDVIRKRIPVGDDVAVIFKPVLPNDLLKKIREILDRRTP